MDVAPVDSVTVSIYYLIRADEDFPYSPGTVSLFIEGRFLAHFRSAAGKKVAMLLLKYHGSPNLLLFKQYRSSYLCSSLAPFPGTITYAVESLNMPPMNALSEAVLGFIDDNHKWDSYSEYAGTCKLSFVFWSH